MRVVKDGNVRVEVYRQKEASSREELEQQLSEAIISQAAKLEELQRKKECCQRLGVVIQAEKAEQEIGAIKIKAMTEKFLGPEVWGYQEISEAEMKIWQVWLPREYRTKQELAGYSFDQIPATALNEWNAAKESGLFQTFTIRTPEKERQQDPIIIGWAFKWVAGKIKKIPYLISRWGESLKPFKEIEFLVVKSWERVEKEKRRDIRMFFAGVLLELIIIWSFRSTMYFFNQSQSDFLAAIPFFLLLLGGAVLPIFLLGFFPEGDRYYKNRYQVILDKYRQAPV